MPKNTMKLAVLRDSWRPASAGDRAESRRRLAFRLAFSCLLLGLALGFVYLVFSPFYHPTTRLFFLTAHPSKLIDASPIPFFQEEAFRFLSADGEFQPEDELQRFFVLESPNKFREVMTGIENQIQHQSDVAIVYAAVQPYFLDGTYFLQCANLDRTNPRQGVVPIQELFSRAGAVGAQTVLLLLDLEQSNPNAGTQPPLNDVIVAIEQLLRSAHEPELWVMVSHSPGQMSYRSLELRGSAFCQGVSLALEGQADANGNRQIDMAEFQRYVTNYTHTLVQQVSGGAAVQTPRLLASFDEQTNRAQRLVIAPVPAKNWQAVLAGAAAAQSAATGAKGKGQGAGTALTAAELAEKERNESSQNWLNGYVSEKSTRIKESSVEELEDNINILPTFIGKRVRTLVGLESGSSEDSPPTAGEASSVSAAVDEPAVKATTAGVGAEPLTAVAARESVEPTVGSVVLSEETIALPDLSRLADEGGERHQLLQTAWQYCRYLEQPSPDVRRPVDWAPHAWRAFVSNLHSLEERERLGYVLDPTDQRVNLTSEIVGSYQFIVLGQARVGNFIKRISTQMPELQLQSPMTVSLGQAEQLAGSGGPPLDAALRQQIQRFDQAVSAQDRTAFDQWMGQVPAEWGNQYVEFFWAKQLAARGSVPWPVMRQCLELARQYERMSSDPFSSNQEIQHALQVANRVRLQGTRQAMDQIGWQWSSLSLHQLERAEQGLDRVADMLDNLHRAWQLRNETLQDAATILGWRNISVQRLGIHAIDEDVELLLDNLSQLSLLLLSRESAQLADVNRYHRQLLACKQRIEENWTTAARRLLSGDADASATDAWLLDALLSTSLARGEVRNQLLGLKLDRSLDSPLAVDLTTDLAPATTVAVTDEALLKQHQFASRLARLASVEQLTTPPLDDESIAQTKQMEPASESLPLTGLDQFYRELPTQVQRLGAAQMEAPQPGQTEAAWIIRLGQLRRAELGLRLMDPNDAFAFDGKSIMTELAQMELWHCLQQKLSQMSDSMADALPQESSFLRGAYVRTAQIASALSGRDESGSLPPPRVDVQWPSSLSLMSAPEAEAELRLTNLNGQLDPLWLMLDFDERLFEVEVASGIEYLKAAELPALLSKALLEAERKHVAALTADTGENRSQALHAAREQLQLARDRLVYPLRVTPTIVKPSGALEAGQTLRVPFRVRRIGSGPSQAKLIWRLIGEDQYARYETMIQLPVSERLQLLADGPGDRWSESTEGLVLHPWPNRQSEFRLGISDSGGSSRTLRVDLLALKTRQPVDIPNSFLTADASREVARLLGDYETLASIPELRLDADQSVAWLPLSVPAESNSATADEMDPTAGAAGVGAEVASSPADAPRRSIRFGLVAMITDQSSQQVFWRRIDFRVRHPSSYVEVVSGYDAISERIEIGVRHSLVEQLPADGIPVRGRVVESLPRGTERRLEGSLTDDQPLALYCQVPSAAPRELTVELDVDDFPRAFVFQVACWRTSPPQPVVALGHKIAILTPSAGSSLGPDAPGTEVKLRVDTARGAYESNQDAVEIGWDVDRDREFANEATVRVAADRQVDVLLAGLRNGRISVDSQVEDLVVNLPPPTVSNARVNLLARVTALGETVWSDPVEVIVDSSSPIITGVELVPGAAFSQEADLSVRVGADDANLSGIARVEMVVSVNGSGEFEGSGDPIQAERQPDGSWVASIPGKPLSPGIALLLVRAVDQVGNQSQLSKLPLEIFSPDGWLAKQSQSVQELSGSVSYGGSELANAKITLQNDQGEILYQTTSNEQGFFRFPEVKVGKYTLVSLGVAKNRPRKAELEVELLAPPAPPTRVQLLAK